MRSVFSDESVLEGSTGSPNMSEMKLLSRELRESFIDVSAGGTISVGGRISLRGSVLARGSNLAGRSVPAGCSFLAGGSVRGGGTDSVVSGVSISIRVSLGTDVWFSGASGFLSKILVLNLPFCMLDVNLGVALGGGGAFALLLKVDLVEFSTE